MSGPSTIEWTERTWNPIVGCSIVSPGCTNCYAMKMAGRIQKMNRTGGSNSNYVNHYDGTTKAVNRNTVWTGKVAKAPYSIFCAPLARKAPTTYFVNSMGDLFHEDCPDEWILDALTVMAAAGHHTFQVLTKRAERMRDFMERRDLLEDIYANWSGFSGGPREVYSWPLHNVWLGVSCERQQEADARIPHLLQTPATVRFISAEPLLGPIKLRTCLSADRHGDWLASGRSGEERGLDWVIVGGESGPRARPMHPYWARELRDQCYAAGVPFFFKQWGEYVSVSEAEGTGPHFSFPDGATVRRLGKKAAGRLLDGKLHNDLPHSHLAPALLSSSQTTPNSVREMKATKGGERARDSLKPTQKGAT